VRRLLSGLTVLAAATCLAGTPVAYRLDSPAPAAHLLRVRVTVPAEYGCPCLAMAIWTPGGYAVSDHAAKVVSARFTSPAGNELPFSKPGLDRWRPVCGGAGYTAELTLWVRTPRTPYSADVEADLLFANLVTVLPYLPEHQDAPATLRIVPPAEWPVACSLPPGDSPGTYTAADWDALADGFVAAAPGLVSRKLAVERTAMTVAFTRTPAEVLDLSTVVTVHADLLRAAGKTFGSLPFSRYLFLYKVGPEGSHGGLEHADGTAMGIPSPLIEDTDRFLKGMGLAAHELVHAWNVKRARPRELCPYDYAHVQRTPSLWVAEGWTSYYGPLLLVRAGLRTPAQFYRTLTRRLRYHRQNPTNRFFSLETISLDSWLDWTAPYLTYRTYYVKGSLAGLDLDLRIRNGSGGRHSLDDLVRVLLDDPELARSGYTEADLRFHAARLAGTPLDAWFEETVHRPGYLCLAPRLASVGLRVEPDPDRAGAGWTGLALEDPPDGSTGASVRWAEPDSPAAAAGLGAGDILLAVDGRTGGRKALEERLRRARTGQPVTLTVLRDGRVLEFDLTPAAFEPLREPVRVVEDPDASPEAVEARKAWLWLEERR